MEHRPKYNPDSEIGVLGALIALGNPEDVIVRKSMLQLTEDIFYKQEFRELYQFIRKCFDTNQWFDISSLMGMGLPKPIFETMLHCINGQLFTGNLLEHHIEELHRLCELRKQIIALKRTLNACIAEPTTAVAADIVREGLQEASRIGMDKLKEGSTFKEIYQQYIDGQFKNDTHMRCGIKQFGDIRNCGLITIAGASGVGKTFFSIYVMDEIIKYQPDKQFLFFSLEMKRNDIWDRYLAIRLNKNNIEPHERNIELPDGRVFDHARIDIDYIETIAHMNAMNKPLSVIVVDYVGLVTTKNKHEREDLKISDITQRLAALAMNLNCTVIGLSQVNRDAAKRQKDDRCPYPSDAADSVGSVRSSSLWIGIDRPETYDNSPTVKNLFVAKCRKTRYGTNFEAWFDFNGGRFKERDKPFWPSTVSESDRINKIIGDMNT